VRESKWPTLKVAEIPEIEKHEGGRYRVEGWSRHAQAAAGMMDRSQGCRRRRLVVTS
jgi:hypothetical protein